jgi:hypothetical protein
MGLTDVVISVFVVDDSNATVPVCFALMPAEDTLAYTCLFGVLSDGLPALARDSVTTLMSDDADAGTVLA